MKITEVCPARTIDIGLVLGAFSCSFFVSKGFEVPYWIWPWVCFKMFHSASKTVFN